MGTSATPGKQIASANSEQEGAIEVRNLVKRYPKAVVNAVDNISFTVGRGEIFGLLGPNGAGNFVAGTAPCDRGNPGARAFPATHRSRESRYGRL